MRTSETQPEPMRLIGYWMRSLADTDYLPPQEFVRPLPDADRKLIVAHFCCGEEYGAYRGTSWCRFYCHCEMGHREFSDGYWVWPEGLAHYISTHGVNLPNEFVEHVRTGVPNIPKSRWSNRPVDLTFWIDWCQKNSLGKYRQPLADAKLAADQDGEEWLAAKVTAIEAKEGLSNQKCQWAGCEKLALAGRVFCARCSLKENKGEIRFDYHSRLREALIL